MAKKLPPATDLGESTARVEMTWIELDICLTALRDYKALREANGTESANVHRAITKIRDGRDKAQDKYWAQRSRV